MNFIDKKIEIKCENSDCSNFNKPLISTIKNIKIDMPKRPYVDPYSNYVFLPYIFCKYCGKQIIVKILE